ncbi:MAG: LEPR-XLL domain-containing protein, partial [Cypionkella sp.]|nr:LEPR-XLL domain-containing protein [Cypionkella sp.]
MRQAAISYLLDPIEPRILLSADPMSVVLANNIGVDAGAHVSATVRLFSESDGGAAVYKYEVRDTTTGDILVAATQITSTGGLNFSSGSGDDSISLKFEDSFSYGSAFAVSVDGGTGADTVEVTSFAAGYLGNLNIASETVVVSAQIGSAGAYVNDVTIHANSTATLATASSQISVNASIFSQGIVTLSAQAMVSGTINVAVPELGEDVSTGQIARVTLADNITVQAASLNISTLARLDLNLAASNQLLFAGEVSVNSQSQITIGQGVILSTTNAAGIILAASDIVNINASVAAAELEILGEDIFNINALWMQVDVARIVGISVGEAGVAGVPAADTEITAADAGNVAITASSTGVITTKVESSFLGLAEVTIGVVNGAAGGVRIDLTNVIFD